MIVSRQESLCHDRQVERVMMYVVRRDGSTCGIFFFQAEDGIRDLVRSRGLGDVYKRQGGSRGPPAAGRPPIGCAPSRPRGGRSRSTKRRASCLLYTSDAADERSSVDLGGRRIIKNTNYLQTLAVCTPQRQSTHTIA